MYNRIVIHSLKLPSSQDHVWRTSFIPPSSMFTDIRSQHPGFCTDLESFSLFNQFIALYFNGYSTFNLICKGGIYTEIKY